MSEFNESLTTPPQHCPQCILLRREVAELKEQIRELRERLDRNSGNSSKPPSSDPPWLKKPSPRKPTGKRPGGQPGHPGHHRQLLPAHEVDQVIEHLPPQCTHCGRPFVPQDERELLARHQVMELPQRVVKVIEHQAYACRCGKCGRRTAGTIEPAVLRHCTGERLSAAIAFVCARVHGSRRAALDLLEEVLVAPLSLGTIIAREKELTLALAQPCQQAKEAVQQAPAKNADETGWKRAGRYLWLAATRMLAVFHIDARRNRHAMQSLLGQQVQGTVCSDRYGVYAQVAQRAICWAHLKRDFQQCVDRGGVSEDFGKRGLSLCRSITRLWRKFSTGTINRPALKQRTRRLRHLMRKLLDWGVGRGLKKVSRLCRDLLSLEPALWRFDEVEGIEPTNNHAERMLRPAVIWRKTSLGSHSDAGCRFVERMLTTIQSLKLQDRPVMVFLSQAIRTLRCGLPPPSLLPLKTPAPNT